MRPLDFDETVELARTGEPSAVAAFGVAGKTIGLALAALVNLTERSR